MTAYDLHWDGYDERVFAALASTLAHAPTTLGCKLSATAFEHAGSRKLDIELSGQLAGSSTELREILLPVYVLSPPARGFVRQTSYWNAQALLSEAGTPECYQERSRFFDRPLTANDVAAAFAWLRRWPGGVKTGALKLFQTGGRVNDVAPMATAFVHRQSDWLSSIAVTWEEQTAADTVARNLAWQSAFYETLVPLAGGGAYQNFIDLSLHDWKRAYYGGNLGVLESIKRRVDPDRVFSFPEAIP